MSSPSIFLLGATGYIGGEVLLSLAKEFPDFPINALVRNVTSDKTAQLQALHPKVSIVEGDLSDAAIIEEQASKADIVMNVAAAGDMTSITATVKGLKQRSQANPGSPPIYIHTSGTGVCGDGARGELHRPSRIWNDMEFKLSDFKDDVLMGAVKAIQAAGTSKESPIRTMVVMPCLVYGIGPGIQKTSLPHRYLVNIAKKTGYVGTFGPGRNAMETIHLKDVASALTTVLKAALKGTAGEGDQGFYFATSKYMTSAGEFAKLIGDILFKKGLVAKPGSQPLEQSVADAAGAFGWAIFGSSAFCRPDRLEGLGWVPEHTLKTSFFDSLPEEIEVAI